MDKIVRKAALAASSDPLSESRLQNIDDLIFFLEGRGLTVELSPYLFGCREADPGKKKAEFLNRCFADPEMEFISVVSGGDLANTVLRHLDYEVIKNSRAMFYGFSDLTTVINAIYARTGKEAVHYQVRRDIRLFRRCTRLLRWAFRLLRGSFRLFREYFRLLRGSFRGGGASDRGIF